MNRYRLERLAVWSGVVFIVLFPAAVVMAGFVPPPSPSITGQELAARALDNQLMTRTGLMLGIVAPIFLLPFTVVVSIQMARIEGRYPVMSLSAFACGFVNMIAFFLPIVNGAAAYYRVDRDPELVRLMHDTAWLQFVMLYMPASFQILGPGFVGFNDRSPHPTFPRWFCYLCFWVALLIAAGGFTIFFHSGPFAWNGLIAFWQECVAYGAYFTAIIPLLLKAIARQEREETGNELPAPAY